MPQYGSRNNRLTIYDMMEAKGVFASNPANAGAMREDGTPLYSGPVNYPKMLYHPQGATRVLVPARVEPTPSGPIHIPAQTELISQIAANAEEEEKLLSAGWHEHPADAIAAAVELDPAAYGGKVPEKSSDTRIRNLEAEIARLQKQIPKGRQAAAAAE